MPGGAGRAGGERRAVARRCAHTGGPYSSEVWQRLRGLDQCVNRYGPSPETGAGRSPATPCSPCPDRGLVRHIAVDTAPPPGVRSVPSTSGFKKPQAVRM
ncbi:hypothetical protein GCM10010324_58390 [Streptomyces hiroshimensis]|uniref:Uncharacterized protein n=1 Tax=Streptomyces hiroshimensis TaxID=66424 RepID=A0ABQ2Z725_9ACTN|nr:hypothetical protein GCM10010324_58390 [Streptomyces hiroshimensis]